ncbi:putative cupin superfamily sugar epimerase [Microbacterium sp. W4I4]|uniref:cupin domain-containing protein n=1 Tax=Microbacterium sp. W4I4 TaxID=3042295 RepID=UPI002789383E|nr:cupin domain-containing protein [Microbacterium sp. W4I4]MDQ0614068.1 putative cupin superfamily sugar epimerase [Microbacterium sp. W4I4]
MRDLRADDVIEMLGLERLPVEGGMFRSTFENAYSGAIYYLTSGDDVSALHALDSAEIWHWYGGAALQMLVLHPDGTVEQPVLGMDLRSGQRPQFVAPAGCWQGVSSLGDWTLVGTTLAPQYTPEGFHIGCRVPLQTAYPEVAGRIEYLTPGCELQEISNGTICVSHEQEA